MLRKWYISNIEPELWYVTVFVILEFTHTYGLQVERVYDCQSFTFFRWRSNRFISNWIEQRVEKISKKSRNKFVRTIKLNNRYL